jgi:hypothetical protein
MHPAAPQLRAQLLAVGRHLAEQQASTLSGAEQDLRNFVLFAAGAEPKNWDLGELPGDLHDETVAATLTAALAEFPSSGCLLSLTMWAAPADELRAAAHPRRRELLAQMAWTADGVGEGHLAQICRTDSAGPRLQHWEAMAQPLARFTSAARFGFAAASTWLPDRTYNRPGGKVKDLARIRTPASGAPRV